MSELGQEVKKGANLIPNYEGITYFKEIDERYITIDKGERSVPDSETVHFDPNSGDLMYLKTVENGPFKLRSGVAYNLRSGEYHNFAERDNNPLEDQRLQRARSLLDPRYSDWFEKPPGYPETQGIIQDIKKGVTIPPDLLTQVIDKDDHILFYESLGSLIACDFGKIIDDEDGVIRIYSEDGKNEHILIYDYDYSSRYKSSEKKIQIGIIVPLNHKYSTGSKIGIWKMSEADYLRLKKYAEIPSDDSVEYPLSREEFVIAAALDGMAFDRWGASIDRIRSGNPNRYEGVTKANLEQAITTLIDRFGERSFAGALRWITLQHLYRLHTPRHSTKMPGVQNNLFGDVHSDIAGFRKPVTDMARQAIRGVHPVAVDMQKDGYGKIGQGVYNAKTIPGDIEFMSILKEQYPSVFQNIVSYIEKLPSLDQGDWYGNSIVNPLHAVREYFPEVFVLMQGYLPSQIDLKPGIEFPDDK